jgi:hypothetical protein
LAGLKDFGATRLEKIIAPPTRMRAIIKNRIKDSLSISLNIWINR